MIPSSEFAKVAGGRSAGSLGSFIDSSISAIAALPQALPLPRPPKTPGAGVLCFGVPARTWRMSVLRWWAIARSASLALRVVLQYQVDIRHSGREFLNYIVDGTH